VASRIRTLDRPVGRLGTKQGPDEFGLPSRWPNLGRLWLRRLVQVQQPESEVQLVASRRGWSLTVER